MADATPIWTILPGSSLGFIGLGASLQAILTLLKADNVRYTAIDVSYSQSDPLTTPVIIVLPNNGIRLRFDGQEQRLRLIEILDFGRCSLTYKGTEITRQTENVYTSTPGPAFRRVYQAFGAAFPGEYLPPAQGNYAGTYILSWPGVAFSFPLQHAAWSPQKDHVSLLGSQAASPAAHMAIFEGSNWAEARKDLFVRTPTKPRSLELAARPKDNLPAEIELAEISGQGTLELIRRAPAQPFTVKINETTPEDLITELGKPDTLHKRDLKAFASEQSSHRRSGSVTRPVNGRKSASLPSSYSSTVSDTYDADFDHDQREIAPLERATRESFWCYFQHGFDILVGPPLPAENNTNATLHLSHHLVVIKVILHGNIPGSYAFNRHRRLRWRLPLVSNLDSEAKFDTTLKPVLLKTFAGTRPEAEMARGKVVNRMWSGSPTDSSFFLPDADRDLIEGTGSEQWIGNTKLYHFPRLAFEVMENGAVSAVIIS